MLRDLESLMPRFEDMVRGEKFDPARSHEVFRVAMSDHASMIVLPSLLASVRRAATHVKLEVSASSAEGYEDVAAGRINMVLCAEEALPSLVSEMLFTLDFVCLIGAALPGRTRRLTLKQYLEFQHVLAEIREVDLENAHSRNSWRYDMRTQGHLSGPRRRPIIGHLIYGHHT